VSPARAAEAHPAAHKAKAKDLTAKTP
jgi:hypothetical protein